jgi:Na+/proline symporter/signal transduction histidine kinase
MENSSWLILGVLIVYLVVLFAVAHWSEKSRNNKWANNPYVYSLSLAVYCSAWTYYGSTGLAAQSGLNYLTTYIGPIIIIPLWIIVLRRIIRISRVNKVSSIADFISLRHGNSRLLGALVSIICICGILPYIALQLKAISETIHVVTHTSSADNIFEDTTTYVAIVLAIFASYYGTRDVDASERRKGIITAVALESVLKLFFFILVGVYVTFFVFDGFEDIYSQAKVLSNFQELNTIGGLPQAINWFFLCVLSAFAIFLLPRQFQMAVIENKRESHIHTAIWFLPLYLLLFNIFVFPIAWGGNILFEGKEINSDFYALLIPQLFDNTFIETLVFLGGFSAAISMIIVSCIGLSTMLSNNVLIPYGFLGALKSGELEENEKRIVNIRRIGIFSIIITAFLIYRFFVLDYNLVSIGMISFVIISQLAPIFFGSLVWRRGSLQGAIAGLIVGFLVCCYTLIIPTAFSGSETLNFVEFGPFGIEILKPFQLLGMNYLDPIPHALFWSLFANLFVFMAVSVSFKGNYRERNYAEMYIGIDQYITNHENAFIWRGTAYKRDIEKVLIRILGESRTQRAMRIFQLKYKVDANQELADSRLIKFSENLLTGHIGTASAKILISSVVKEEKVSLTEVLEILEESKENIIINKKLTETSKELERLSAKLKSANEELMLKDKQKDEFLDTVTHELRTPITAIRAASEILHDDDDTPEEIRQKFLQNIISESDRLNRLIDKILDLEKFETGKQKLHLGEYEVKSTLEKALNPLMHLIKQKNIDLKLEIPENRNPVELDEERIIQVLNNLISNSIKFADPEKGKIAIEINQTETQTSFSVFNNGKSIPEEDLHAIFDKFFQSSQQTIKKPIGTGLGLAISQQIIEAHQGKIWAENLKDGVKFTFVLQNQIPKE